MPSVPNKTSINSIEDYVVLSMQRITEDDQNQNEIVQFCAIKCKKDHMKEYLEFFVTNSKRNYNEHNKKAVTPFQALELIKGFIGDDEIIIMHDGGRKDIEYLNEMCTKYLNRGFGNKFIDIEKIARHLKLEKTSLKEIAVNFGVHRLNANNHPKTTHNAILVYMIWTAMKEKARRIN